MLGLMAKLIFWDFENEEIKVDNDYCDNGDDDYNNFNGDYDVDEGFDVYETEEMDCLNVSIV